MRLTTVVLLLITCAVSHAETLPAPTVAKPALATAWTSQALVAGGQSKKLVTFGEKPSGLCTTSRCIAGTWQFDRDGESDSHFTGIIEDVSYNHARKKAPAKLAAKVRKTRQLMSAFSAHRTAVHAIMRGSGQLLLREVTGGEWEVIGYSTDALGDLFAHNPRWKADPKAPPKPGAPTPIPDPLADGVALAKQINDYRASLKLPRLPSSPALTKVAQAHVRDLHVHQPVTDSCNLHSWSKNGTWTSCCYDGSKAAARCMWNKPKEIAKYPSNGYEIAARNPAGMTPESALSQWQHSDAHHVIVINRGIWTQPWGAFGVAVLGDYAVAWFGYDK
jgi:hypothetical protein